METLVSRVYSVGRSVPCQLRRSDCCSLARAVTEVIPLAVSLLSSENLEGLDVYMRVLQLLTTVDDGVQAIGKAAL